MGIYNDLMFTEAAEQVEKLIASKNSDEIGDRIEEITENRDLAMVCLMYLVMKAKGIDTSIYTPVELTHVMPTIQDLVLPPGVNL